MTLPTIYKQTKTGAIQQYSVTILNDMITVTQGQVGGAMQSYDTITLPKNIGKSNQTSG